jgi:FtsH-binding integral membrane protein
MQTRLARNVNCPNCHKGIGLNDDERNTAKFECPWCQELIDKSYEIIEYKDFKKITSDNKSGVFISIVWLVTYIVVYVTAGFIWHGSIKLQIIISTFFPLIGVFFYFKRFLIASNIEIMIYWFGISLSFGIQNSVRIYQKTGRSTFDVFLITAVIFFLIGLISLASREEVIVKILKYKKKISNKKVGNNP